jgi:hypothetical protein
VKTTNPEIPPLTVASADASTLRHRFTPQQLVGILESYVHGLSSAFALAIAVAALSTIFALIPKWSRLNDPSQSSAPPVATNGPNDAEK